MKKRLGKRRSIQKDNISKRQLVTIIGSFLVLGFVLSFISVPQDVSVTGEVSHDTSDPDPGLSTSSGDTLGERLSSGSSGFLSGIFTSLNKILLGGSTNIDEGFVRWTFFIIFSIFFYSIFSMLNMPENKPFVHWLISIPLAFLVIAMINRTDFLTSIQGYGAIGLTIITMLPLGILILFSSQLLQKMTVGKIIFQLLLWWYFFAFSLYLIVSYLFTTDINEMYWPVGIIMISPVLVSGGFIMFNKKFRTWVGDLGRGIRAELAKDTAEAGAAIRTAAENTPPQ